MTEDINKSYVKHYVDKAKLTDSEAARKNYLYRAGTQMELDVLKCDGDDNLTPKQQQAVLDAAQKLLGEPNV